MAPRSERGFTLIELLIVVAIISIIAAFAVPGLLRTKMTGNEASALASLKVTNTAQVSYSTVCGGGGYAVTYPQLYAPAGGAGSGFISADLGLSVTPMKSGYNFALAAGAGANAGPNDCNGTATATSYYATAVPTAFASSGGRSFATNQENSVWQVFAAGAPTEPFGPPATTVQ